MIEALFASWKEVLSKQLSPGSPFETAREQMRVKGIGFNVRILLPSSVEELRRVEPQLTALFSEYGFITSIERDISLTAATISQFDADDVLVIIALSSDIEAFCVEFAKDQSRASRMLVCIPEGQEGKFYCRTIREVYRVPTVSLPLEALSKGQQCRFGIDVIRHCANYLIAKVISTARRVRIENTIVVLVHGIRTRAMWQGEVKQALEGASLLAYPTNYNKFDLIRFLAPLPWFRRTPIRRVEADIAFLRAKFPEGNISILAHSFGTYIVGRILQNHDHQFDRIAFCGSVLKNDFAFDIVHHKFSKIVNEVGCRDIWPVLAAKLSWGYGATGSFGFSRGPFVDDRRHAAYGHSHFLNGEFCRRFWVPFFCGDPSEPGDAAQPYWLVRFIDRLPLAKTIFWGAAASLITLAAWSVIIWLRAVWRSIL